MLRKPETHSRRRVWPLALMLLDLLSVASCYTVTFYTRPSIAGRYVTADGHPVANVTLFFSAGLSDSLCATPSARAVTDSLGQFHFDSATYRTRAFILMEHFYRYRVCAPGPHSLVTAYQAGGLGPGIRRDSIECTVDSLAGARCRRLQPSQR